ncbi:citrate/2-methylcitrate synthase [Aquabacterium sp. J223]|uniref:citrate/2-methylcitrate synthase n=1 Tax=Aquabacterium sp. J223 TaxID=2898431 RepID=UPI0021ADAC6D|nr:citrate/2-methylcitrate synthase [Aquabacterium sp. J223]
MLARKLERDGPPSDAPSVVIPNSVSSVITEIHPRRSALQGRHARALPIQPGRLENLAELLWTGMAIDEPVPWESDAFPPNIEAVIAALQHGGTSAPILRVMASVTIALGEAASSELRSGNTMRLARRLVYAYAGCLAHLRSPGRFLHPKAGESMAALALRALDAKPSPSSEAAMNGLFICCADHELSPATFAARVVASTGAGLHACLIAALGGQSGLVLGGGCDRAEDFFATRQSPARPRELAAASARGEVKVHGFESQLYPHGDPRAEYLLELAAGLAAAKALADIQSLVEQCRPRAARRCRWSSA